jgi:hypothetical protein
VVVTLLWAGDATNTVDYTRSAESLTIPAGSLFASLTVTGLDDGDDEPDELVSVAVDSVTGGVELGDQLADITIVDDDAAEPGLEITGFDVQRGASQRSFIRYIGLSFSSPDGLAELLATIGDGDPNNDRIRLTHHDLDGLNPADVPLSASQLSAIDNAIEVDFGVGGITGTPTSNAGDGYYEIELDLDGDGGFDALRRFHRLLGDMNGNGIVNSLDVDIVNAALGQSGINHNADVNGDGVVNQIDRVLARRSLGRRLNGGLPLDD